MPSDSLADWVSYADQVSVVTVVSEEQSAPPGEVAERGEGHIAGTLTLRIDETIWAAPGVQPRTGELRVGSIGWTVHDGRLRAINPAIKAGATYLVALARFDTGIAPMRPISLGLLDGKVLADNDSSRSHYGEWVVGMLHGRTLAEVRAALEAAPPDEVARRYAHLDVVARIAAVRREVASGQR